MKKRLAIIDSIPSDRQQKKVSLIQGQVPTEIKREIERWLRSSQPKRTWNDFIQGCCISFLSEIRAVKKP